MERKKLIDLLPEFVRQFKEFQEMMKAEEIQMNVIDKSIQKVLNNAFIEDCDEYGIKKYETLFNIKPSIDDSLAIRRSRVLLRWNDTLPYTYRTLIRKLDIYCGVNQYTIENDLEHYKMHLHTYFNERWQMDELKEMLNRMLPLNIFLAYLNTMIFQYDLDLSALEKVSVISMYLRTQLEECIKEKIERVSLKTSLEMQTEELKTTVTTKKNAWYFDGTFLFNGEKQFNAEVNKEVL